MFIANVVSLFFRVRKLGDEINVLNYCMQLIASFWNGTEVN